MSTDLRTWELLPEALTAGEPGGPDDLAIWTGCVVRPGPDDPWHMLYTGTTAVLLFSCLRPELSAARAATVATGGIWAVTAAPGAGTGRPFDVASARLLVDDRFYVGKLVRDRDGSWVLLAFLNRGPDDTFVGAVSDPMPVVMTTDGLQLA